MKLFKRLTTLTVAAVMAMSCLFSGMTVSAVNEGYRQGSITEDFETLTVDELKAGKSDVVNTITDTTKASITDLPSGIGKTISLSKGGAFTTKSGLIKYDITVVDFYMSTSAVNTDLTALVQLKGSGTGAYKTNGVGFNGNGLKSWYLNNGNVFFVDSSKVVKGKYYPIRLIFNKNAKTITATLLGEVGKTSTVTIDNDWNNWIGNAYLQFNGESSSTGAVISYDDITVSDGFYLENDYINENFEHINNMSINAASLSFARFSIFAQGKTDETDNNTYLKLTPNTGVTTDQFLYGSSDTGIKFTEGMPTVIKFRARANKTSSFKMSLRLKNGTNIEFLKYDKGAVTSPQAGGNYIANDEMWHTYRIKITPRTGNKGCDATVFADTTYLGTKTNTSWDFSNGGRMQFYVGNTSSEFDIDDIQVCYPSSPSARLIDGSTDSVACDNASFTFEGNNPIHTTNFSKTGAIVLKEKDSDDTVPVSITFETKNKNNFIVKPTEMLKPNTEYTISFGNNIATDMYDQYFSGDLATFKTAAATDSLVASVKGTVSGKEIAEGFKPSGNLTLTVSAYSANGGEKIVGYAAIYNSDFTTLLGVQRVELTTAENEVVSVTGSDTLSLSGAAKCVLLVWEDGSLKPLKTQSVFTAAQ